MNNKELSIPIKKSVSQIAEVIAEATLQNDVSYKEFIELYKMHMVRLAKKKKKKSTVVEISARTGIDRRFIVPYLKSDEISVKPSKVAKVYQEILSFCKRNDTKKIIKADCDESFEAMCYKHANGSLTPKAIYTELWRLGLMKDTGSHYKLRKAKKAMKKTMKASKRMNHISEAIEVSVQNLL